MSEGGKMEVGSGGAAGGGRRGSRALSWAWSKEKPW